MKRIALAHVADLERRMAEMAAMKQTLEHLAHCCQGDQRPDCPILDELAHEQPNPPHADAHGSRRAPPFPRRAS